MKRQLRKTNREPTRRHRQRAAGPTGSGQTLHGRWGPLAGGRQNVQALSAEFGFLSGFSCSCTPPTSFSLPTPNKNVFLPLKTVSSRRPRSFQGAQVPVITLFQKEPKPVILSQQRELSPRPTSAPALSHRLLRRQRQHQGGLGGQAGAAGAAGTAGEGRQCPGGLLGRLQLLFRGPGLWGQGLRAGLALWDSQATPCPLAAEAP